MEMRRPSKETSKDPGTMGSTFPISSGRQKRGAEPRWLWLPHLPCAGAAAVPVRREISPPSGWPREAISAWLSVYTLRGLWHSFFFFLWHRNPKSLLTARLNNFSPSLSPLPVYTLRLLWTITRVRLGHCFTSCYISTYFVLSSFLHMPFTPLLGFSFRISSVLFGYFSHGSI